MNMEKINNVNNEIYNGVKPEVWTRIKNEAILNLQLKLDGIDAVLAQEAIALLKSNDNNFTQIATSNWPESIKNASDIEKTEKNLSTGLADRALEYSKKDIQEAA